ncbi:MCP four helix bundle domain-containing protein [Pelomonas sp. V22]|uniref:MCP four helix bundle domain-containing protein n=1 Tax=Pelomonas sp. V22 TaxID=2822139 RepID=UPI0024A917F1|nr:MCP four helix bundle domain-containing protein [Pelomonas sp. V22]MDI4631551.1 MCP four helix bundle domain-containing protein [Pelomonas sp. V22]
MKLSNVRVGLRMGLGFGTLLLMLLMGLYAANRVSRVQDNVIDLSDNWLPSTQQIAGINEALNQMRRAELQMLLGGGAKAVEDESARLAKQWQVLPPLLKAYGETLSSEAEREQFKTFNAIVESYRQSQDKLVAMVKAGQQEEALAFLRGESRKIFRSTADAIGKLTEINTQGAQTAHADAE